MNTKGHEGNTKDHEGVQDKNCPGAEVAKKCGLKSILANDIIAEFFVNISSPLSTPFTVPMVSFVILRGNAGLIYIRKAKP